LTDRYCLVWIKNAPLCLLGMDLTLRSSGCLVAGSSRQVRSPFQEQLILLSRLPVAYLETCHRLRSSFCLVFMQCLATYGQLALEGPISTKGHCASTVSGLLGPPVRLIGIISSMRLFLFYIASKYRTLRGMIE